MRIVILTYESLYSNLMTERLLREASRSRAAATGGKNRGDTPPSPRPAALVSEEFPGQVVGIVRSDCLIYQKSLPAGLMYLVRQAGLRFVGRKALELFQSRATAILFKLIGREPKVHSLRDMRRIYGVPVIGSTDVNSAETRAQIAAWQPDVILSIYLNQLIKGKLIDLAPQGVFNIHPALLPRHRGLFPYFWVIGNREPETGVTIHWVDRKFDTGDLLLQQKITVAPDDTITSLSYKSSLLGAEMLVEAVKLIEAGNPPRISQDHSQASYHTWPTPADQRRFRKQGGYYGTIFELWKHM